MLRYISICFSLTFVIIQVASQTVYVDIDTGKVLGVTPGQGQQQQRPQQYYPQQNNGNFNRRNHWRQSNGQAYPSFGQPMNPAGNNVNAEWVCRNSKTGDMMIIASEINSRLPEQPQQQPNNQQQPNYNENPYQHNPWLDQNNQNQQQNNQQNPPNNNGNNANNYPTMKPETTTEAPTPPPIILTTSTKTPFPTLDNIDWTKYLETTKKPDSSKYESAINGEGVIMPRGGDN